MTALPNLRQASATPARPVDIHEVYAFVIDLEKRAEINLAICQSRQVCARHERDLARIQKLIDIVGEIIDRRGECRATARTRELRSREHGELMERLK